MNRRSFSFALAATPVLGLAPGALLAQPTPDEGIDYRRLKEPVSTMAATGKIEVLEFFWYACPHCDHLEPHLAKWKASLPVHVEFRKVHVAFRGDTHQRIFYTLEAMDRAEALGPKVFDAIHREGNPLSTTKEAFDWAKKMGLDPEKFEATWNSFGVQSQQKRANALINAYAVGGVPMFAVNGKYMTSPAMVGGSHARALQVVDYLVAQERRSARK
jgi:protein dithiol oxidoreductase (disulfide-forming)